jgi:hypothetical protein
MSPRNIFVVGWTGVGKTTYAKQLCLDNSNWNLITGSTWVTQHPDCPLVDGDSKRLRAEKLTKFCLNILKKDITVSYQGFLSLMKKHQTNVIEGIRNPSDFVRLFDPSKDEVVFLVNDRIVQPSTTFEKIGLETITHYVMFLLGEGLVTPEQIKQVQIVIP